MTQISSILVIGATGAQGGSVARHLLADERFTVRCLTRNSDSDRAQALRDRGAEVVGGSLDDQASRRDALTDCQGCSGVTNFWEHFAYEETHGRNLIDVVDGHAGPGATLPHRFRIHPALASVAHHPGTALPKALRDALARQSAAPARDDFTILAVEYQPQAAAKATAASPPVSAVA